MSCNHYYSRLYTDLTTRPTSKIIIGLVQSIILSANEMTPYLLPLLEMDFALSSDKIPFTMVVLHAAFSSKSPL